MTKFTVNRAIFFVLFLVPFFNINAKNAQIDSVQSLQTVDSVRMEIERLGLVYKCEKSNPKSVLLLQTLADDIMAKQSSDSLRLWALMDWMVANLKYDAATYNKTESKSVAELAEFAIKYKKGCSAHFASLYAYVANLMGYQSVCIDGYTREAVNAYSGKAKDVAYRDTLPYRWCACKVNNVYHVFDPTLAVDWKNMIQKYHQQAGSLRSFNPRYFYYCENTYYFRDQRMAFDPLLQLDSFPRSYDLFDERKPADSSKVFGGNYTALIDAYLQQDDVRQKIDCLERIKKNGKKNPVVEFYDEYMKCQVDEFFFQEALFRKSVGDTYYSDVFTIKNAHAPFKLQKELKEALVDAVKCYEYSNASFDSLRSIRYKVRSVTRIKSNNETLLLLRIMRDNVSHGVLYNSDVPDGDLVFPKSALKNPAKLAEYIQNRFDSDTLRLWTLMEWMAKNIAYDYSAAAVPFDKTKKDLAELTLKKRMAKNDGFEALFSHVSQLMGIPTISVEGYSYGQIANHEKESHLWTICKLGDYYHMFDPTLAAIDVDSAKKVTFVPSGKNVGTAKKSFPLGYNVYKDIVKGGSSKYFMCEDNIIFRTRFCAFDPLFQLSSNPLSCSDFERKSLSFPEVYEEPVPDSTKVYYYKWSDLLDNYVEKDDLLRRVDCMTRIEKNGTPNRWTQDYLNALKKSIDNTRYNDASDLISSARKYQKNGMTGDVSSARMAVTLYESANEILKKMMTISFKNKANISIRENSKAIANLNKKLNRDK